MKVIFVLYLLTLDTGWAIAQFPENPFDNRNRCLIAKKIFDDRMKFIFDGVRFSDTRCIRQKVREIPADLLLS